MIEAATAEPITNKPLTTSLRLSSNLLSLWALCGKPACRRTRRCRRDPEVCVARYSPLVPEEARLGALMFYYGLGHGASPEEVRFGSPGETAALDAWTARVAEATCGGQARETCDHKAPLKD
jgi:hypothetical protein